MTLNESRPFRVLHDANDLLRQERAARGARIDKLGVDRSRWAAANMVLPQWSAEALHREPKLEAYRSQLMLSDRIEAWRQMFKLTLRKRA